MKLDACIVGGGPAGLISATKLASNGFNTTVFEQHSTIGEPNHCSGLISIKGLKRLGINASSVFHQNTIYGGRIYFSDGEYIEVRNTKPIAYVIDRASFDRYIAGKAEQEGVIIQKNSQVKQINRGKLGVNNTLYESEVVINAEGAGGGLMRRSGYNYRPTKLITGLNVELNGCEVDQGLVEVWFGDKIAKDFFAWVIPINESCVRVGLGTSSSNSIELLKNFTSVRFQVESCSIVKVGQICIGGPVDQTVYDNILLVGDVAGQVKATTGGGIIFGGLCAQLAGEVATNYLENRIPLTNYDQLWRKKYGYELKTMQVLRKILNSIDSERLNRTLHIFKTENIEDKLQRLLETGDMDMQSNVIKNALFDPKILSILIRGLGRLALSELFSLFK